MSAASRSEIKIFKILPWWNGNLHTGATKLHSNKGVRLLGIRRVPSETNKNFGRTFLKGRGWNEVRAKPWVQELLAQWLYNIKYIVLYFTWKICRFISQVGRYLRWFAVCVPVDCRIVLKLSILGIDKVYIWYW